jgi:hypothetical protein
MTIELKFKEGDTVWFIHNLKAIETVVRGIKIERRQMKDSAEVVQEIIYLCSRDNKDLIVLIKVNENSAHPTKEALLQSL